MEQRTNLVTLSDERKVGYCEFGPADGVPVIYFHGWPACGREAMLYGETVAQSGVRLIAPDRPGFGVSDFARGRTLLDYPGDISELADCLGLEKFHLLGNSGGGPYAAACAYSIPDRLLGTTIVAGLSPMDDPRTHVGMRKMNQFLLTVGRRFPLVLDLMMKMTRKMAQNPDQMMKGMSDLPEVDKILISACLPELIELMAESFGQGTAGATHEGRIYASPWGFELSDITVPITIWQGSLDVNVPLSNGRLLASEIPNAKLNVIEGEGHFSMAVNQGRKIFEELLKDV